MAQAGIELAYCIPSRSHGYSCDRLLESSAIVNVGRSHLDCENVPVREIRWLYRPLRVVPVTGGNVPLGLKIVTDALGWVLALVAWTPVSDDVDVIGFPVSSRFGNYD